MKVFEISAPPVAGPLAEHDKMPLAWVLLPCLMNASEKFPAWPNSHPVPRVATARLAQQVLHPGVEFLVRGVCVDDSCQRAGAAIPGVPSVFRGSPLTAFPAC